MTRIDDELQTARRLIVVGADFTPASAAAMSRAKLLATSTESALLLAHVVPEAAVVAVAPAPGAEASIPMPSPSAEGAAALKAASDLANERIAMDLSGLDAEAVVRLQMARARL